MAFTHRPGKRESLSVIMGLAGGTGSGKTYSGMLLAKGMAGGNRFAVLDTENGRANFYADDFDFEHGMLSAPFRPANYLEAIEQYDKERFPVILVDSASHEYAGEGGILDWHEEELDEFVARAIARGDSRAEWQIAEAQNMRAWSRPKMEHKAMMARLLQVKAHLILCFRAEPKIEIVKDDKTKQAVIREKQGLTGLGGWFPVCEKNMPFELATYLLLAADRPGVPKPITLREPHRGFFPPDKPITEEAGRLMAEWAAGGIPSPAMVSAPSGAAVPPMGPSVPHNSAAKCPKCFAPAGKPHASGCAA